MTDDLKERLLELCNGHLNATIPWPHRVIHDALAYITDLESRLAAAKADRDKAREYAAQARIRENKAEDARVSAVDRATRAEAGEDALAECLRRLLKGDSYRAHSEAALAAYEARREK